MGTAWEIFKALVDEVLSLDGGDDELRLIKTNGELRRQLAEVIMAYAKKAKQVFAVLVNYSQPLTDAIAAGYYDYVNPNITQDNFPKSKTGEENVPVELLHFGRFISTDDALAEMAKQGYRPAVLEELLAFGRDNPEIQRQFPIVALGSVAGLHGDQYAPYLVRHVV